MTATGTGTWTAMSGNPGTATITTPTSPTTTITSYSAAGTYNFIWTNGSCSDTAQIIVNTKANAGPDQSVNCVVLPGGSATMAATGTGTWTAMAGNPGTPTISTPTSPTTSITNFSAAGTYNFIWTNGGCSDTAQVIVTAKPNAGIDQTVSCVVLPGGSATMAATGTGTWTAMAGNPGTVTINTPTSPTTTITSYSAAGTYNFIWTNGGCSDTAKVVVTAKPNAGVDQTVNCVVLPGGSATMAATGTGTWTAMSGNPGSATITAATSPTTSITNFSAAGTYNFIWTNGSCSDTAQVVVTAKPNAGVDQTVSCVVLPGGSATMAATGAGTWTAMSGNPGSATIATATSPTTSITNFSAAGTYNFIWTNGGCSDTAKVVVTAKPNAGVDQTVNCVVLPGGSATMAATGTGTWTAMSGNAGSATITTATSPTTSITNFSAAGTYNFIWTNGSCSDTAQVVVTAKPNAGVDQTVSCVVLPGGSATMAATGAGTWTAMSGNPGSATIATATSPTTSITNFSAAGTYNFIWMNGGCSDTASVIITSQPDAGNAQSSLCQILPGGNVTMNGSGSGVWSAMGGNPGTATITTSASPTTSILNFSAAGTYYFIYANGSCSDTATVTVTAQPEAGSAQSTLCQMLPGGNVTMNGSGSGVWSAAGGNPGIATINSPASPTTSIINFSVAGTYQFIYSNGTCHDTAVVLVSAKPNAGVDQTVSCVVLPGGSATMAATGTGTWTAMSGNPGSATITTATSPTTSITNFSAAGTYNFIWTNGGCSDTAKVVVTAKPNAGVDQTVNCVVLPGGSATMAATGTGTWTAMSGNAGSATITTATSPTTSITNFSAAGTYNFIWTNGGCSDTAQVVVTAKPNAGVDQTVSCVVLPGGSATMAATGTGTWTAMSGNPGTATITTPTSPTTSITNFSAAGTYNFIWTNGSCSDTASVIITSQPDAGNAQSSLCQILPGGNVTMNGSGSGVWSALAGNPGTASIISTSSPTTAIQNFSAAGAYIFVYSNATCSDTVQVAISEKPQAGSDQFICQHGTITTAANSSGGVWSPLPANPAAVTILNATSTSSSIGPFPVAGNFGFIWTANSCTDTMMVTVKPVPAIVDNYQSICTGYSYISPGNHVYTITGNYYDTLTAINGCDSIILTHLTVFPAQVFASGDTNICKGSSAVIHASGALYYQWTPNIAIDSVQSANPMVNPSQTTTYIVTGFVPGPNQLVNGDFSSGNNGFSSGYTYNPTDVTLEGTYAVNVNANNVHSGFSTCTDHTSGSGNFMVVNGSATPNSVVWQQTIQVNPGTDYVFGAWVNTVANGNPALLQFSINGSLLNTPFQAPSSTCNWSQFYANWNSGSNSSATITIVNQNTTLGGNDFGLDDIFFAPICFNKDSVKITVHDTTITTIDTSVCQGTNYTLPKGNVVQLAGTYIDTFATIWGCDSFVITNLNIKANPTVQIIPDTICNGQLGTLNSIVNPSGGVYNWLGTGNSSSVLSVSPSSTTSYILIYTSNGCSTSDTDQIVVNPVPVILVNDTAICSGYDALLHTSVSVSGGNYLWSSGAITPNITLHPGATTSFTVFYEVNGCADTAISHVTVNGVPAVTLSAHAAICTTDNGWIAATVAGGSPQYHYNWQPPAPDNDSIFNLITGSYQLIVVDSNHCSDTAAIVVGRNFPAVTIALQSKRNIRCFGTATGAVDIDVSPVATYNYVWNTLPAQITQDVTGLTQGNYTVIATDSLGCADTATFNLTEPSALIISGITKSDPLCYHGSNGTATVTATGGSGGYHYSWNTNPAQHTATAVSLSAQTYTATVTDDSACAIVDSIQLNNPPALILNEISNRSVSCNSGNDGESQVATTNGTPPYAYVWNSNPVQHDSVGNQLPSGTYSVSVSDFNSCTATLTVTINEPQALAIVVQPFGTHCFNGADGSATATVTGGVAPYHYLWSNGDSTITADSLIAGTISVTASDAHGCSISASSNISQPTAITNQVSSTRTSCYNISDGTITCTAAGGTGSFQFALYLDSTIFINSNSSGAFTQLARGNYWILISDGNGCQIWTPVHVPSAPANSYSAIGDTTSCFGVQYHDATIVVNSNEAANSPFSYTLDGIITQPNGTFVNVGAGNHQVLVSDKFGCDTVIVVPVIMPEEGVINILPDTAAIYLGEIVQLNTDFTPYLASSISNYHWSPSVGLSCSDCADPQFNYFGTMTYHLTVTYNGQCTATDYITIHVENDNRFYIPNVFTPNGDGANDVFYVYGKAFKQMTMKIFNRWGEKVFESNSEKNGWDGSFKGEMQEPGVYVYEVNITFIDNKTVTQTGSVTLLK
ncbi:MAG: gliding motility-associated C-terminal domain-containing protein [Chitinophagales bacterium]